MNFEYLKIIIKNGSLNKKNLTVYVGKYISNILLIFNKKKSKYSLRLGEYLGFLVPLKASWGAFPKPCLAVEN